MAVMTRGDICRTKSGDGDGNYVGAIVRPLFAGADLINPLKSCPFPGFAKPHKSSVASHNLKHFVQIKILHKYKS